MAAIATGLLGMGYLVALAVYVFSAYLGAGRALDGVCASLGLTSESYWIFGRRYHGSVERERSHGRQQIDITFLPSRRPGASILNIYVYARLGMRMAIGQRRPLLDCRDCPRLDMDDPALAHLEFFARDEVAARTLLADPAIRAALSRLMVRQELPGLGTAFQELYVQPDRIWFRSHAQRVTEVQFRQWLDDLVALAQVGEMPSP
jgi:hypothetical protein